MENGKTEVSAKGKNGSQQAKDKLNNRQKKEVGLSGALRCK